MKASRYVKQFYYFILDTKSFKDRWNVAGELFRKRGTRTYWHVTEGHLNMAFCFVFCFDIGIMEITE